VDFAYLLREDDKPMCCEYDRHVCGVCGRDDWLHLLAEVGFTATVRPLEHSAVPPGSTAIFAAHKFRTPRRLTMAG
jgi:hypothetical protein